MLITRFAFFTCLLGALLASPAWSQASGAKGGDFIYKVQPGDTLLGLVERFTNEPKHWRAIQDYNHISNPHHITVGKELRIPFKYIDTYPSLARINNLKGDVFANDKRLSPSDILTEGQVIKTLDNSSITFTLINGNIAAVAPNSIVHIQRLRSFSGTGLIDSIFHVEQGEFSTQIINTNKSKGVGRFQISSPISITGVRGTVVRNRYSSQGAVVELLEGKAQVQNQQGRQLTLKQKEGVGIHPDGRLQKAKLPATPSFTMTPSEEALSVRIAPQADAQQFLLRYTSDAEGYQELERFIVDGQVATLPIRMNQRRFYLQVRAINAQGLAGNDTQQRVFIPLGTRAEALIGGSNMLEDLYPPKSHEAH